MAIAIPIGMKIIGYDSRGQEQYGPDPIYLAAKDAYDTAKATGSTMEATLQRWINEDPNGSRTQEFREALQKYPNEDSYKGVTTKFNEENAKITASQSENKPNVTSLASSQVESNTQAPVNISQEQYQLTPEELASPNGIAMYNERIAKLRSGNVGQTYNTGNPELDAILAQNQKFLDSMLAAGKTVNPDIELTPAQITEFTNLAHSQIDPYYRSQITAIQSDLQKSVDNLQKQYELSKSEAEAKFKSTLSGNRETMAGSGTTFSGQRGASEQQLASAQNRALDLNALQTEGQIGSILRDTEGRIGSGNLPTLAGFNTGQATTEGLGGFTPGRTLNFATTGGITGTIPQEQKEAELLRLSKYKQAARQNRSLDYYL